MLWRIQMWLISKYYFVSSLTFKSYVLWQVILLFQSLCSIFAHKEHISFAQAAKDPLWLEAIHKELNAL